MEALWPAKLYVSEIKSLSSEGWRQKVMHVGVLTISKTLQRRKKWLKCRIRHTNLVENRYCVGIHRWVTSPPSWHGLNQTTLLQCYSLACLPSSENRLVARAVVSADAVALNQHQQWMGLLWMNAVHLGSFGGEDFSHCMEMRGIFRMPPCCVQMSYES